MRIRLAQKAATWAVLGGIAYVLCFPRYDLPMLALLVMPLFLYAVHELRSQKEAIGLGFLLSAMVSWGGFHWILYVAQYFGEMPFWAAFGLQMLFCLVAAPQMVAFFAAAFRLRFAVEKLPIVLRPLFWAALYVFLEYLARFVKIFPENLGNTWIAYPSTAQAAALGGVSLLTFLPLYLGASLFYLRKAGRRAAIGILPPLALLALLTVYGGARIKNLETEPSDSLRVGIIQPNLPEIEKMAQQMGVQAAFDQTISRLLQASSELASRQPAPDLLLWPETIYPLSYPTKHGVLRNFAGQGYANLVRDLVVRIQTPLLFGGYETESGLDFNSAILLGADGGFQDSYRKNVLLAFGEYMPFAEWLPVLKTLNPQMGDFGRGAGPVPITFHAKDGRDFSLGLNICYEEILPEYMRSLARGGARAFVNITKDSWFGDTFEPWEHFQLAALRAVENGIPLIRATNTGLSGYVLPTGAIHLLSLPFHEAFETITVPVPKQPNATLYTILGEWFALACLLISLGLGTWAVKRET